MISPPNFDFSSQTSVNVHRCSFEANFIRSLQTARTTGGALYFQASLVAWEGVVVTISGSNFTNNVAETTAQRRSSSHLDGGGALFASVDLAGLTSRGDAVILLDDCLFESNRVAFTSGSISANSESPVVGGAIAAHTSLASDSKHPAVVIQDSQFISNSISSQNGATFRKAATGGAVFISANTAVSWIQNVFFERNFCHAAFSVRGGALAVEGGLRILDSSFLNNTAHSQMDENGSPSEAVGGHVYCDQDVRAVNSTFAHGRCEITACGSCAGGAISSGSVHVTNSNFESHSVTGGRAAGGSISAFESRSGSITLENVTIIDSKVIGDYSAVGGAVQATETQVQFINVEIRRSSAVLKQEKCLSQSPEVHLGSLAGAISIKAPGMVKLKKLRVVDSVADLGGVFSFSGYQKDGGRWHFSNISLQNSTAVIAGGAIFFPTWFSDGIPPELLNVCNSTVISVENCTAKRYGSICASAPRSVDWDAPFPINVPTSTPFSVSLVLRDLFKSIINPVELPLSIIPTAEPIRWRIAEAYRDSVVATDGGVFWFRGLEILGNGSIVPGSMIVGNEYLQMTRTAAFDILPCLPGFQLAPPATPSGSTECHLCPRGTYSLPQSSFSLCIPCSSHAADADERLASDCLKYHPAPRVSASQERTQVFGRWEIAEGFYPSPSFAGPTELLKCASDACEGSNCTVRKLRALHWRSL